MRQDSRWIGCWAGALVLSGAIGLTAFGADLNSWEHAMPITLSGYTKSGTLADFPALVVLSTNRAGFGYSQFSSPTGDDLRFSAADGSTELDYEIDTWNTNGDSLAWVKIPVLSGTNTLIWAYWGNETATPPPCTTNGAVWADTYVAVWHFSETNGALIDATGHGVNGTVNGSITRGVAGRAGRAFQWPEADSNNHVDFGSDTLLGITGSISIQAWLKTSNADSQAILSRFRNGGDWAGYEFNLGQNGAGKLSYWSGHNWSGSSSSTTYHDGAWHHLCVVQDPLTVGYFVDGAANGSPVASGGAVAAYPPASAYLGRSSDAARPLSGSLDEVRVSAGALTEDWIWADYMTLVSNDVFSTYGTVQSGVAFPPSVVTCPPTAISLTSADLVGCLTATGSAPTTVHVYWGTRDGGSEAGAWAHTNTFPVATALGSLATNVSFPASNILYFYRFRAVNSVGEMWSTTATVLPGVVNVAATTANTSERPGTSPGIFTISRPAAATNGAMVVTYTLGGTAVSGTDYTALSTNLTLAAGTSNATVTVSPLFDLVSEPLETVVLTVAPGAYITGSPPSATLTIAADPELDVVALQGAASADNCVQSEWSSDANSGAADLVTIGNASGADARALLWFDTTSIPRRTAVYAASLTLTLESNAHAGDADTMAYIHPIFGANAGWGEGDKIWAAATAGESCWDYAKAGAARWVSSAGTGDYRGLGNPGDAYESSPIGSFRVFGYAVQYVKDLTQTLFFTDVTSVQNWVDAPAQNAGLIIRVPPTAGLKWQYYSREVAIADYQPRLTLYVTYLPRGTVLLLR